MNDFFSNLKKEVDGALKVINHEELNTVEKARKSINLLEDALNRLKEFTCNYVFENKNEEIIFFKESKPRISSYLLFYRKVCHLEMNRPLGGELILLKYFQKELEKINDFFEENKHIYHYYRSSNCFMDECFFLRGKQDLNLDFGIPYCERDTLFSTNCDYHVTQILANDLIESYIMIEMDMLNNKECNHFNPIYSKSKLTWTGSKSELIELIYALESVGCFNYGKASLKLITRYFEQVFNIDLGANISRVYSDLRIRQKRTSFIDKLLHILNLRMDKDDK